MFYNYFKIAYRNLVKYKFISFINIFGLTLGLTCCLLISTYIINELSYDKYNEHAKNIYRVERTFINPETGAINLKLAAIAPPAGPLLQNDFKDIKQVTRLLQNNTTPFRYEDKKFNEQNSYFADEHLFDLFNVQVIKGNPAKALNDPFCVMLSEALAKKYFGNEEPLNKVIRMNNQFDLKVTGVYRSFPANAHLHPELMISFNTLKDTAVYGENNLATNWGNNAFFTYILLPEGYNPDRLEAQFPAFLNRHINDGDKYKPSQGTLLSLRKLTDIHLLSHMDDEAEENGDIKRVYVFSAIALFILLIACINYMNLSTARSVLRAREIGIRKVVGAQKKELVLQFLSESVLICWIATLLAILLTRLALPWLNDLSNQQLSIGSLFKWQFLLPLLLLPFVIGIVSGMYPALFLSSFQPIKVLKGIMKAGGGSLSFRKALVVVQFSISIILIVCTTIVFEQMRYMQQKALGFNKDHVITLAYNAGLNDTYESFKTQVLDNPGIKGITRSSRIPSGRLLDNMGSQIDRGDSLTPTQADIKFVVADEDFIPTYGVGMVRGRNFSKSFGMDTSAFLVNEAAVKVLGLKSAEDAIGKRFQYGGKKGQLVGVFNDFHFESLHQRILPLVLFIPQGGNNFGRISIKISGSVPAAIAHIESTWKQYLPEIPFDYTFLDDNFSRLYLSEQRQESLFTLLSFIAIFIASLGLLGLSAFTISQRLKEIGIRKVLGATVNGIVTLLSKDFLKLVLIAGVIAFPVAWFAMHKWLEDFAYRIAIHWWVFLFAGIMAALVAFITISFQAVKAARSNPVKNLRTE
ncbi:MAG TPA: FtsX-like permease family protein [Flavisolibacter sp.]|nr:FtsX-like permease family protein [Flavisolibacter sp.]